MSKTEHGLETPAYGDMADVADIMEANNAALEAAIDTAAAGATDVDMAIAAVKEMFTNHLIDEGKVGIIVLHDYDNEVVGQVVYPLGHDPRPYIDAYVRKNLIHPELQGNTNYSSAARTDTYRGEYPHTGPDEENPLRTGGADTVEDGADYPLTNHLDYCFIRDTDEEYPYASGWTEVTEENIEDVHTALSNVETFGAADTDPTIASVDWSKFSGGSDNPVIARFKAVYRSGTILGKRSVFCREPDFSLSPATSLNTANRLYYLSFQYDCVNNFGYGTSRVDRPALRIYFTPTDSDTRILWRHDLKHGDIMPAKLEIPNTISKLSIQCTDTNGRTILGAASCSQTTTIIMADLIKPLMFRLMQENYYGKAAGGKHDINFKPDDYYMLGFYYWDSKNEVWSDTISAQLTVITNTRINYYFQAGIAAGQTDPYSYTWYQIQHAIYSQCASLKAAKTAYLTPEAAKEWGIANLPEGYVAYGEENENVEGGDDTAG